MDRADGNAAPAATGTRQPARDTAPCRLRKSLTLCEDAKNPARQSAGKRKIQAGTGIRPP